MNHTGATAKASKISCSQTIMRYWDMTICKDNPRKATVKLGKISTLDTLKPIEQSDFDIGN